MESGGGPPMVGGDGGYDNDNYRGGGPGRGDGRRGFRGTSENAKTKLCMR